MKTLKILLALLFLSFLTSSIFGQLTPKQAISQMGRGINIGNTMEPPNEGDWGNGPVQEFYFDDYKNSGFTNVRIPITWQGHTSATPPYTINAAWLNRVEQVVDWGLKRGLIITINAHHEGFIKNTYTQANKDRFDSIWSQIATRFRNKSDSLLFEIINEPYPISQANIDDLNARVLSIIRKTNPTRIVLFSGNDWASVDKMIAAAIPPNDTNLIAYFHSYDPYPFGLNGPGTYTDADTAATKSIFDRAANWSTAHNIPVVISELGAVNTCAYNSRMYCYFTVIDQSLKHGIAFDAWDDNGGFQIYKRGSNKWNEIKDILIYTYKESPTKLRISQPASDSVILTWTNRTTKNDSIVIERKTSFYAAFDTFAVVGPALNTFVDTAVTIGKTYYYRLLTHIKDSIYPMSYPISISLPYFKKPNPDTTVADSFGIKLLGASDPDAMDAVTYKLTLNGLSLPKWLTFVAGSITLKSNLNLPVIGTYPIVITATDRAGQIARDTFNLTVDYVPSGLKEVADRGDLIIYPIPAKESINISCPVITGSADLSIFDCLGKTVLTKRIEDIKNRADCEIKLSNIPSGVYIVKLSCKNSVLCRKIYVNK